MHSVPHFCGTKTDFTCFCLKNSHSSDHDAFSSVLSKPESFFFTCIIPKTSNHIFSALHVKGSQLMAQMCIFCKIFLKGPIWSFKKKKTNLIIMLQFFSSSSSSFSFSLSNTRLYIPVLITILLLCSKYDWVKTYVIIRYLNWIILN